MTCRVKNLYFQEFFSKNLFHCCFFFKKNVKQTFVDACSKRCSKTYFKEKENRRLTSLTKEHLDEDINGKIHHMFLSFVFLVLKLRHNTIS